MKVTLRTFRRVTGVLFAATVVTALPLFVWYFRGAVLGIPLVSIFLTLHVWAGALFTLSIIVKHLWFEDYCKRRRAAGGDAAPSVG